MSPQNADFLYPRDVGTDGEDEEDKEEGGAVASVRSAKTMRMFPKRTNFMKNTTMSWVWSIARREMSFGVPYDENCPTAFVLLDREGNKLHSRVIVKLNRVPGKHFQYNNY